VTRSGCYIPWGASVGSFGSEVIKRNLPGNRIAPVSQRLRGEFGLN